MIHRYQKKGLNFVLDVNSGAVHLLDDISYAVSGLLDENMGDTCPQSIIDALPDYTADEIREAYDELYELKKAGQLFAQDDYIDVSRYIPVNAPVKALCLHVAHDCNLRCKYCMPHGVEFTPHEQILTYEEFLRIAQVAVRLGITRFKITGGEPLVRKGVTDFIVALKRLPGVEEVTLTTNGVRLAELVPALKEAGVDGVNISLDAADPETFQAITGFDQLGNVLAGLDASLAAGLHTKINFVLLAGCEGRVLPVAKLAQSRPVDVRFIEVMPIGAGAESRGLAPAEARKLLLAQWPDLHPVEEHRGNGPAHYDASARLLGRIGWIEAVSHAFCASCNRARVTSTGLLKPCLCYGEGTDLRALLRGGAGDAALEQAMAATIYEKPRSHCFGTGQITEQHVMAAIGG